MIVVVDASTFVSAALKADSVPERALLRALHEPNRLLLSQAVEDEYREVLFRPKFDRYVTRERRQRILDIVIMAADRIEPTESVREYRDPKDDKYLALAAAGNAGLIVSSDVHDLLPPHPGAAFQFCRRHIICEDPSVRKYYLCLPCTRPVPCRNAGTAHERCGRS